MATQAKAENPKPIFLVQVLDRQNATWQGRIKLLDSGKEKCFRSALELFHMMDDIVDRESACAGATHADQTEVSK